MTASFDKQPTPTIRDLYPHLTDAELERAEDNLERYLIVVLRIFERLESEKESAAASIDAA